ncbi:DUF2961 domain-containing protein [Catenulispora sp. NF23]|uniref:DUF2961 domain-containing protein n=1 Tax=Catenulispora pinistramenti TaxID=2705254 RepID=UPI001BA805F1|nr:DUF2961 domain-containing protein [Catenulispora pinistramenti]MBS2532992.1 DUF2961 domain-containing protein [Catenulispora pinistramenti]
MPRTSSAPLPRSARRRPAPHRRRLLGTALSALLLGTAALALQPAAASTATASTTASAVTATKNTVGWDTYRNLDQLPYLTDGVSTRQFSSFDRQQANNDTGNSLGPAPGGGTLLAAHSGPGEVDAIWMTGGVAPAGKLRIVLDGQTVVDDAAADIFNGGLKGAFTYPLVANDSQSSGGFYIEVPMPFTSSMQISTDADPGYYHVAYRTFPDATGVSTFSPQAAASDVVSTLQQAGDSDPKAVVSGATTTGGSFQVLPGQTSIIASGTGSGQITGLNLRIPHLSHPTTTPITDDGDSFLKGGTSTFTVSLNPANTGIRITRRYDPHVENQQVGVTVNGAAAGQWLNGAATAAAGQWADQTLAAPASATAGKSSATIVNTCLATDLDCNEFTYWIDEQVGGVWQSADTVDVGPEHAATEAAHRYSVTKPSWSGTQMYSYPLPASVTDTGDAFAGGQSSTFTVAIDPANDGVRLTRRLDPNIAGQVASVSVDKTQVGTWTANPQEPNGSWLDESLEIPASVTAGKSSITITNTFVSSAKDFNEFSYWVDSHMPTGMERTDQFSVGNQAAATAHGYSVSGTPTFTGSRTNSYPDQDQALASARIRISFDGVQTVDAPLGQFFGSNTDTATKTLMSSIDPRPGGLLSSWWPMPYGSGYSISIYNASSQPLTYGDYSLTTAADPHWATDLADGAAGYFHATSDSGATTPGQDWTFLNTTGHGKVVGVVAAMNGPTSRGTLEGDERAYTDGSQSPEINGTGTEDYFQGGWYFKNGPFTLPVNGESGDEADGTGDCPSGVDCTAAYRLLLNEAIPFSSKIRYGIEHGGHDDVQSTYTTTALWYGSTTAAEAQTDSIALGNVASESAHDLTAVGTGASADALTSDYEGNDGTPVEVSQCVDDSAAATTFTLQVNGANQGVVLQRTSDQDAGGQSAAVSVDGTAVGTWLEPLANPYHRWLDDEFAIPASATAGKTSVTVTITPHAGSPWSAAGYRAVSIMPGGVSAAAAKATATANPTQTAKTEILSTQTSAKSDKQTSASAPTAASTGATPAATTPNYAAVFPSGNGSPAIAQHQDGRVEVFAVSPTNAVNSVVETKPEAPWSPWCGYALPGRVTQVVSATHLSGRLEDFAVTPSGGILNNFETAPNGPWSGWNGFGPATGKVTSVEVARHADGRLEVFAVMSDGSIQNKYESAPDKTWSGWNSFAPTGTAVNATVAMHQDGRLEVFAVNSGGGVQNKFETAPDQAWSSWSGFGPAGKVASVRAGNHANGRLEVFAVMSDGSIQNKYENAPNGTWSGWNDFANPATAGAGLTVAQHADGRLDILAVGTNGVLQDDGENAPNGTWSGWSTAFGPSGTVTRVSAATHQDGRLEVLAVMADGSIQNKYEQSANGTWSGWNGFAPAATG